MIQLDFGDHRPLHEQIRDKLKELIISGMLAENEKIPSVREMAVALAINPNTIQKAYKELESEGYIFSLKAKGSFVSPRSEAPVDEKTKEIFSALEPLIRELRFLGINENKMKKFIEKIYEEEEV